jgi:predicted GNAT family acetyltransferase
MGHPLDQPIWSALAGRHAPFAIIEGGARRYEPEVGVFAAVEDEAPEPLAALAALVRAHGEVALLQTGAPPTPPGLTVASQADAVQMGFEGPAPAPPPLDRPIELLTDADAPAMLALATLTRPGPFYTRTHELGGFVGIKDGGRLVAMAGERMKPDGFTEVSGVCAHPDYRGRGYGAALSLAVMDTILARGETPFLHAYASNTGAIGLYQSLGFTLRRQITMTVLTATPGTP